MRRRTFNFPTLDKFKQTKNKIRKNFRDIENQIQKNLNQSDINDQINLEIRNINRYYNSLHANQVFETEWEVPQTVLLDSTTGQVRAIEHTIRVEIAKIPDNYITNMQYKVLTSLGEGDPEFNPGPGIIALTPTSIVQNEIIGIEDIEGYDNLKKVIIDVQMFLSNFNYSGDDLPSVPLYKFKLICNYPITQIDQNESLIIDRNAGDYL